MECLRNQLLFLTLLWDSEFQDDSLSRYLLITCCVQATKQGTCSMGMDFVLVEFTYWLGREKYISRQTKKVITNPCVINETTRNRKRRTRENCKARPLWRANIWAKTGGRAVSCVYTCDVGTAVEPKAGRPLCVQITGQCWLKTGKWVVDQRQELYHLRICSPVKGFILFLFYLIFSKYNEKLLMNYSQGDKMGW